MIAYTLLKSWIALRFISRLKPNMEFKFWRNKAWQEIDFVLLKNRRPLLIEIKTTLNKPEVPPAMKIFIKNYPETAGAIIYSTKLHTDIEYLGKQVAFRKLESLLNDELIANWWHVFYLCPANQPFNIW